MGRETEMSNPTIKKRFTGRINWFFYDGGFWIRILGYGISVTNKDKHSPLFSERYGYRRVFRIGKWGIKWLIKAMDKK